MNLLVSMLLFVLTGAIALSSGQKVHHCRYEITVYTGTKQGAGTDADVYMRLQTGKGTSFNVHLLGSAKRFKPGGVDRFVHRLPCAGRICRVEVTQNGKNANPSWYAKGVDVTVMHRSRCISRESFTINQWIRSPEKAGDYHWSLANNCGKLAGC